MSLQQTISKELLEQLYCVEGKTLAQIGHIFGKTAAAILYWCKKYKITTTNKKPITKSLLSQLYVLEKKSLTQIGTLLGCSSQTILNRLREFDLPVRTGSEALTGRQITWGRKIAQQLHGRKRPGVGGRRRGCVAWNKGISKITHPSLVTWGMKGSKHWAWKGGISTANVIIRQSPQYKLWRTTVFKRDNYTCRRCNKRGGVLHAHHILKFSEHLDLRFDINNGLTLCKKCHTKLHKEDIDNGNIVN